MNTSNAWRPSTNHKSELSFVIRHTSYILAVCFDLDQVRNMFNVKLNLQLFLII